MQMKLKGDEVEDLRRFLETNEPLLGWDSPGIILKRDEDGTLDVKLADRYRLGACQG